MSLATSEQDEKELDQIFAELYELSNGPFARIKAELDSELAHRYKIKVADLQPWHYHDPFFQESPMLQAVDLDKYYLNKDVRNLAATFFAGIDLPVESILARSDLYEKDGKNPHAFCTDIDREGDVRVLCNLQNNERWMETMLHELGHAVYDYYQDPLMPYTLRQPAHAFTTEAIAMFFGRLSRNPDWMQKMLGLNDASRGEIESVSGHYSQLKQLVFARWSMVMYHFEKELYANPDQDLNKVWWDLVEKYQGMRRPENRQAPDWAAKIHFTIAPCYYHNYLLGELFASQLYAHLADEVLTDLAGEATGYVGEKRVGNFLRQQVFTAGSRYHWNEMIKRATGEPLTAKYFVKQFVN
jgi:peptidyl-dipeptidase A